MNMAGVPRASLVEASWKDGSVFQWHLSPLQPYRSCQGWWHSFKRYDNGLVD